MALATNSALATNTALATNSALATTTGAAGMQVAETEALVESAYRRLLSAIEAEREKIRGTWQQIEQESGATSEELERLRQDTEEWCQAERYKVDTEWRRLDKLREDMAVLWPVKKPETLEINCSGEIFEVDKAVLCSVEGSMLNHMFSKAFVQHLPRDPHHRFFLDFNPKCFAIVVKYLEDRQKRPDVPVPAIPIEQQQNMDLLAEALNLKPFLYDNRICLSHKTSLKVNGNVIHSTHSGWQVISAQYSIRMSGVSYFEVRVLENPGDKKGGLAVGVSGHIPEGKEAYTIIAPDAVYLNSGKGLVGSMVATHNVAVGLEFEPGSVIGVKHDVFNRTLQFYFKGMSVGTAHLKSEMKERMRVVYPVFALMHPKQRIEVDFKAYPPAAKRPGAELVQDRVQSP